jgi:hypothetical protein
MMPRGHPGCGQRSVQNIAALTPARDLRDLGLHRAEPRVVRDYLHQVDLSGWSGRPVR